jgi:hypothetical protein
MPGKNVRIASQARQTAYMERQLLEQGMMLAALRHGTGGEDRASAGQPVASESDGASATAMEPHMANNNHA